MYSDTANSVPETIRLFVIDEMLDITCKDTNEEGCRVFTRINEEWKYVAKKEFVAFIVLLILCGVLKKRKEPVYEL
jgi:hypothetical protein